MEYNARLYKLAVTGYGARTNTLNLFDLDSIDESIVHDGIAFDKTDIDKNLTLFLYPDDSDEAGRRLRVYQQYLMVSAGAQLILAECAARGCDYHDLADYAAIQINDTHPSMVIPELIRLLGEKGIEFEEAVEIVTKTCAYTNHTILAEALEKWPRAYLDAVVPQLMPIIEKLDELARTRTEDESLAIIDKDDRVHMAHMDIHFTHSTNGVATLHTEILKNSELHGFYELYPEKFNNKTNGITFRRWLLECDPRLTATLEKHIGSGFRKDAAELEKLLAFADDEAVLGELTAVKKANKAALADWLLRTQKVTVNPDAMFDIQSKRLHEYKRQQLNLLYLIHQYYEIKAGHLPAMPLVSIFGAKAAPGYHFAKSVIKLINEVANLVNNDESLQGKLKVVFLENYRVSLAELIIPAADVSEQISLASKEASGTSNMKFMMTGAITLATLDGANIEIKDEVGDENVVIFGMDKDEVYEHYARHDYYSRAGYEINTGMRRVVDTFVNGTIPNAQAEGTEIYEALITHNDEYFLLEDFAAYVEAQEKIDALYRDHDKWARMSLANIAKSHKFTSDDTITEYAKEIWELKK